MAQKSLENMGKMQKGKLCPKRVLFQNGPKRPRKHGKNAKRKIVPKKVLFQNGPKSLENMGKCKRENWAKKGAF